MTAARQSVTMKPDWSIFTKQISINATTWALYNAWTVPAEMEKWFLSAADFTGGDGLPRKAAERVRPGDTFCWKWHGFAGGSPLRGRVIEANTYDNFRFTFAEGSIVDVAIIPAHGVKLVRIQQRNIPPDESLRLYLECAEGWTFYLTNLKSFIEGGIDLRNKDERVGGVINS